MADRAGLPPLREVIARHGIAARKVLGQHFLLDLNLTGRIARAAGDLRSVTVVEVGPGPGGLTRALLAQGAKRVIAIERDRRCAAALAELAQAFPRRLEVIAADALTVQPAELAPGPLKIVANLPFNIGTRLLLGWLAQAAAFENLTLTFQKEVAERLIATPGSGSYGRLSVAAQWRCEARRCFDIPPRAFVPPPKVTATVVLLIPRPAPLAEAEWLALERVVWAAFGARRKMLRTALKRLGVPTEALLEAAGVDPAARAESLSVEQFCALARAFKAMGDGGGDRASLPS